MSPVSRKARWEARLAAGLVDPPPHHKVCVICKKRKPASDFWRDYSESIHSDGLQPNCKVCWREKFEQRPPKSKGEQLGLDL